MGPSHRAPRWTCKGKRMQLAILEAPFELQRVRVVPSLGVHSNVQECIDLVESSYTTEKAPIIARKYSNCKYHPC